MFWHGTPRTTGIQKKIQWFGTNGIKKITKVTFLMEIIYIDCGVQSEHSLQMFCLHGVKRSVVVSREGQAVPLKIRLL